MAEAAQVVQPLHLLLLPLPPKDPQYEGLVEAFGDPLTSTLKLLQDECDSTNTGLHLDIALPVPYLYDNLDKPRTAQFAYVQKLIAGVYKLICVTAAKEQLNVEDAEGIDVRVLLVAYSLKGSEAGAPAEIPQADSCIGPVTDFATLGRCQRPWKTVYAVSDNEQAEEILKQFLVAQDMHTKIRRVGKAPVQNYEEKGEDVAASNADQHNRHFKVVVGGSFDHIHIGHKLLLTMFAFLLEGSSPGKDGRKTLIIGITGDDLLTNKQYAELVQRWGDRQASTWAFLRAIMDFRPPNDSEVQSKDVAAIGDERRNIHTLLGSSLLLEFAEIPDAFGPTITDESVTAIVVSAETRSGGKAVNEKRSEKGWHELETFEVVVLNSGDKTGDGDYDETFRSKLSSTKIREALSKRGEQRRKS